jgi:hypothetical protein
MKKLLIVLLILSVAGSIFAVDLGDGFTLGGEVKSGFGIFSQDDGDDDNGDDTYIQALNDDAGSPLRGRLNFGWAGDVGGTKFRLQANSGTDAVTMPKAFGWVNLLDKKIVIWGGHGVDDIYGTGADDVLYYKNVDGGDQVRIEVRPIGGLSLAFGLPLPIGESTIMGQTINNQRSLANAFGGSMFGAKFSNDTLTALVSARLNPGVKGTYYGKFSTGTPPVTVEQMEVPSTAEEDSYVELVYALKVPSILPVGINITGSFESGDAGYFRIGPKLTFEADKLDAHVQGDINIDMSNDTTEPSAKRLSNFGKREKPEDDNISIGFEVGAGYQITDTIGAYLNLGSDNISYMDGNGLYVKPGAALNFGPNTSIEIFDKISNLGTDDKAANTNGKIANQFQVEFVWKF